jgi:translation initiation factor 5B
VILYRPLLFCTLRFREQADESVASNNTVTVSAGDALNDLNRPNGKPKGGFSEFASLQQDNAGGADEEEEDFGGLMVRSRCLASEASWNRCIIWDFNIQSTLKATTTKNKKKPKKGVVELVDVDQVTLNAEVDGEGMTPKKPVGVTAEDLADEEWGPVRDKDKGKKTKKGKGKKGKAHDESDNEGKLGARVFYKSGRGLDAKKLDVSWRVCDIG